MSHFWSVAPEGETPIAWTNFILMRDIFHCTPTELKKQPIRKVTAALTCLGAEQTIRDARRKQREALRSLGFK